MFLLDTNVLSELRKGERCEPAVRAWARARPTSTLYVSVVSLMELEFGVLLMRRRDTVQGDRLLNWYEQEVLPAFERRTLVVDLAVTRRAATLHAPNRMPDLDALIAATALVHAMTLVTRNVRDFERTEVPLLNPWDPR
jgi:predicted nucleic acid-binding protein